MDAIGITDHVFSSSDLLKPTLLRSRVPRTVGELGVYVGCEAEMHGPTEPTIGPCRARRLAFVVMAASHLYFLGERALDELSAPAMADLILNLMEGALALGYVDILAHPFRVNDCRFGFSDLVEAVDRDALMRMAEKAAKAGVAMECNPRFLREGPEAAAWLFRSFLGAGCKLSIGSDAHWLVDVGCNTSEFATEGELRAMGLSEDSLWTIRDAVRRKSRAGRACG